MRLWAATVLSLTLLSPEPSRTAQDSAASGASLAFDVVSPSTQHEPVVLYVVIRNQSSERVFVDLGRNRVGNTQITITGPRAQGSPVTIDERLPKGAGGLSIRGTIYVEPHRTLEHEIVLNRWADFDVVGSYVIQADFVGRVESPDRRPIAVERHWVGDLRVNPRNEQALRETCDKLTREIEGTDDAEELLAAIDKLAAVNDPVAVEYLDRAAKASRIVGDAAIRALERIGNDSARNVLSEMSGGADVEHGESARRALIRLDQRRALGK